MLHHKERHFDERKQSFVFKHNIRGESIVEWVRQYQENETYRKLRRPDSVILSHEILSWHRDDTKNITIEKLEAMAREYIKLRKMNGMAIAVSHSDKQHLHIHFCFSGLEYHTGKSLRMSKAEFTKLKKDIQQFQIDKFPELSNSIIPYGKGDKTKLSEKEYQMKLRTSRESQKEQVVEMIKTCYRKANSKEVFFQLLNETGLETYNRGGKTTGITFKNYKFRFSRLGFTDERIEELQKSFDRGKELYELRKAKEKNLERFLYRSN